MFIYILYVYLRKVSKKSFQSLKNYNDFSLSIFPYLKNIRCCRLVNNIVNNILLILKNFINILLWSFYLFRAKNLRDSATADIMFKKRESQQN